MKLRFILPTIYSFYSLFTQTG